MHCARSKKRIDVVYQYARHLCLIDRGVHLPPIYIYIHCARSRKKTDVVYWYARHLCLIEGGPSAFGIYMCLVYIYIYIYIYIYRSAIPLHLAVKLICFTIGLFILLSKDFIIRTKSSIYMNLFILIGLILVVVVVMLLLVV